MELEELATKVMTYRVDKGLTQQQMAQKLRISNATLSSIENCKSSVKKITVFKVLKRLEELENE